MGHVTFRPVSHCAFCSKKANSKEHAWPDWLIKKLVTSPQLLLGHIDGRDPRFDPYQRAIKVKCVCIDCNTKWLKTTFEDTARPLLIPLIDDIPSKLDVPQQATIAAWAAKTAMIFEFVTSERELYYTDDERRLFRSMVNPLPPSFSAVWLGRLAQGPGDELNFLTVGADGGNVTGVGGIQAYATTMAFGHLVIQIVSVRAYQRERLDTVIHPKNRSWASGLVRVWPASRIRRWPPEQSFSAAAEPPTLLDLHRQFDNLDDDLGGYSADDVIRLS